MSENLIFKKPFLFLCEVSKPIENIKVKSIETPNDWEVSFKLDGQEFMAAFVDYFGSFDNRDE